MEKIKKIIVGMSGASGAPITVELLKCLQQNDRIETHFVMTKGAELTLEQECGMTPEEIKTLADVCYDNNNIGDKIASGSFRVDGMVVVPCSMKTIAGIVSGYSDNLLLRACDVTIKEQRKLILVARESPLSTIHLRNMYQISQLGVMIVPPMTQYYSHFDKIDQITQQFVQRLLEHLGLPSKGYQWGGM